MHRLIRPNKSCQVPSQHIILDTETIPGEPFGPRQTRVHKFRLACACCFRWENGKPTREKWVCSYKPSQLMSWIQSILHERRLTWIWAHSAKFDWTSLGLWTFLTEQTFSLEYASIDSRPNFLMTRNGKKSAWWIDSCNWFAMSLAELGESVGIEKMTMPPFAACDKAWEMYCHRDVRILRAAVVDLLSWIVENDMGCLRLSCPGQAMQAYRHRFAPRITMVLPTKHKDGTITEEPKEVCLPITHGVSEVKKLERRGYFQGAVRVNCIGEVHGPVYCLDVNSCYPSVMLDGMVPTSLDSFSCSLADPVPFPLEHILECIADVEIHTVKPDYPLRQSGRCVYPVGRFWTTLPGPELLHAYQRGRVIRVGRWAKYKVGNLFGDYVRCLWDFRCQYRDSGSAHKEAISKWMLTSLPGKFGQRSHKWEKDTSVDWPEPWGRFDIIDADTNTYKHYRSIAWLIEREEKPGEHPESFPAVSAFVTSLARVKMLNDLEVTNNGGQVYYSAVDSIQTDLVGYENLVRENRIGVSLGQYRLERVAQQVRIRGIANYSIDGEMHVAGLPRSFTNSPNRSGSVQGTRLQQRADRFGKPQEYIDYDEIRSITPPYVHGRVNPDGTTRPWILPLEETEMNRCLANAISIGIFD